MSNTDGALLKYIYALSDDKLCRSCFACALLWLFSPIAAMVLNVLNIDGYNFCGVWITFLYISGGLSLLIGGIYLFKKYSLSNKSFREKVLISEPLILAMLFFVWSIFCVAFAEEKIVAIYGYERFHDNLLVYLFYIGMIIMGVVIANSKEYSHKLSVSFLIVSAFLAVVALMNNNLTDLLCRNSLTESSGYESVFISASHYSMYLVVSIMLCSYLLLQSNSRKQTVLLLALFELFSVVMALCQTLGSILATLFSLLFLLVSSITTKKIKLQFAIVQLVMFVVTVLIVVLSQNIKLAFPSNLISFWENAIQFIYFNPVVGVGPQNYLGTVNNVFLKIGVYTGAFGLILYSSSLISILKNTSISLTNPIQSASLLVTIGYILAAFFGETMFYIAPYFYFAVGMMFGTYLEQFFKEKN